MRRVALTGATGFIGRHLSARLLERGDEVVAIVRPESPREPVSGVRTVRSTLDAVALSPHLDGMDVLVHLAGVVSAANAEQFAVANVAGTLGAAVAAGRAGARLVHISSLAAAGPAPARDPRDEADAPAPMTPYGRSKLAGEHLVETIEDLRWTILRPGAVYGPGDRAVLPVFAMAARGFLPLFGRPDAAYTFVHVRDLVRAIDAAIDANAFGETFFVGHPEPVTSHGFLEAVRAAVNPRAHIVPVPAPAVHAAAWVCDMAGALIGHPFALSRARAAEMYAEGFVCSVDRARERLGVEARIGLGEGFAETAAWYRKEGWLKRPRVTSPRGPAP